MKNNHGITMISLIVTIILMGIITATLVTNIIFNVESADVTSMYADIEILESKVNAYYLEHKTLPVLQEYNNISVLNEIKNPNDNDKYYVINLNNMQGITLRYGKGYYDVKDGKNVNNITDIYIVNEKSHTVYYMEGIEVEGVKYYTRGENYSVIKIDNIENAPRLSEGMRPVKYVYDGQDINGGYWQVTTTSDRQWYNYNNKQWANVMLEDGLVIDENGKVEVEGSMFVWIPRFAYQITSGYNLPTAGNINVKFLKDTSNIPVGEEQEINAEPQKGEFIVHPAFNYGGIEISGFWIAKFESSNQYCTITVATGQVSYSDLLDPIVKSIPNVTSWRNISIDNIYRECINMNSMDNPYGISQNSDTHLLKNSEWGAVSYLAQSKIGKNSKIWINPNNNFITGQVGTSESVSGTGTTFAYNTINGINASSTGNITGIYDLAGGSYEYVASYINNSTVAQNSKILTRAPIKHKDVYQPGSSDTAIQNYNTMIDIFGNAIFETSNSYQGTTSWYSNNSIMPAGISPFFVRGSHYNNTTMSGIFAYEAYTGEENTSYSFRVAITVI